MVSPEMEGAIAMPMEDLASVTVETVLAANLEMEDTGVRWSHMTSEWASEESLPEVLESENKEAITDGIHAR